MLDSAIADVTWVLANLVSLLTSDAVAPGPVSHPSTLSTRLPRNKRHQPTGEDTPRNKRVRR